MTLGGSGRLKDLSLDCLPMDETLDIGAALAGLQVGSPLSLLSPNALPAKASPGKATKPLPAVDEDAEEGDGGDALMALPSFNARRARSRPDPRRQSSAIFSSFAEATSGAGLLDDSEIAVGDEDIQLPLAKSAKLLGGAANHSSLWLDPDTDEMMGEPLPEPSFGDLHEGGGDGGAPFEAGAPFEPTACPSPAIPQAASVFRAPAPPGAPAASAVRRGAAALAWVGSELAGPAGAPTQPVSAAAAAAPRGGGGGVCESTAVFGELTRLCEGAAGLDDFDEGEAFQMQVCREA